MDQMIRKMLRRHDPSDLAQSPDWLELLELYDAMKKMLPASYLRSMGGYAYIPDRRRRRMWKPRPPEEQQQQQQQQQRRRRRKQRRRDQQQREYDEMGVLSGEES
jgi:alpha-galactosidase/6-phospho-beta-glucosidase family protein